MRKSLRTSTTAGITSPAFSMMTVSPMRISLRADLFLIMQSRAARSRAADENWVERRERRQHSGAPDLHQNTRALGFDALGLVLKGDGPTWRLRCEPRRSRWAKESTFTTAPSVLITKVAPTFSSSADCGDDGFRSTRRTKYVRYPVIRDSSNRGNRSDAFPGLDPFSTAPVHKE